MQHGTNKTPIHSSGRPTAGHMGTTGHPPAGTHSGSNVICRKCKSPQIVANKRGYSFAKMFLTIGIMIGISLLVLILASVILYFATAYDLVIHFGFSVLAGIASLSLILALPVGIMIGFVGRSNIVNGCMNCGFKWNPAKKG